MDALSAFYRKLSQISIEKKDLTIEQAREVVKLINEFLYCSNPAETDTINIFGNAWRYISDFHKYWEKQHKNILDCKINEAKCEQVADALHQVYITTKGKAFSDIYDTCGLTLEQVCQVRMLTANQDFRGSRNFNELAEIYIGDHSIFDAESISKEPESFVKVLKLSNLSQNDKRISYAKNIAEFVLKYKCTPFEIITKFNNDVYDLRNALIHCNGAGYGNKKADMFIRDMVVLGIWKDVSGFDKIDVASDINTIKVALRTGIISTAIPLVSSFLDIFCHQYSYMDEMNALAWRKVWEVWKTKYSMDTIESPCLIDYFVYGVIGKQFCKEILVYFECEQHGHNFYWHSANNKTCQICFKEGRGRIPAKAIKKMMPCLLDEGSIAITKTKYVMSLPEDEIIEQCPFKDICGENKKLMPPKSISILGQTGWTTAYTEKDAGGGGLMA
ncbi:MAG: hypothetical protein IJB60_07925 [Bacteroidaceae bacterium]|nr:hypothetical protein [Bacteroidaceae bacterium]